jgi:hypothetical protein
VRKNPLEHGGDEYGNGEPVVISSRSRTRLSRILLTLCALSGVWAIVVAQQRGFELDLGTLRILASRRPRNPALASILTGLAAWLVLPAVEKRCALSSIWRVIGSIVAVLARFARRLAARLVAIVGRVPSWASPLAAGIAVVAVVATGLLKGAFVAGGSDSYGYVSQAELWATGRLRIEQPFMRDMKWESAAEEVSPLGYRPALDGDDAIVPIYPPGLPMIMAVFERLGGRRAVFYAVPMLGGLAVWATYQMGTLLAGRDVGVFASVLLATSPVFLFQLMLPMSDVPATAWWAVCLALILYDTRSAALFSGLAAGAAILTRPNLLPLAGVPGLLLVWRALKTRSLTGRDAQRVLLFAAGAAPACVIQAILNAHWYGAPLANGYGPFDYLYEWRWLVPNLQRYPRWLLETQTPVVLLAVVAPLVLAAAARHRALPWKAEAIAVSWWCFIGLVCLSYFFHEPNDTWFWLRYLLPAWPALCVLTSVGVVGLVRLIARGDRAIRIAALTTVLAALAWHGIDYGRQHGTFDFREGERKAVAVGAYVARTLPEQAALLSLQECGSLRYYAGRLTVRYDYIAPSQLDLVINHLRQLGYHPYIVLEQWEEPRFRARFRGRSALAALDWPPVARLNHSTKVSIYDPADKEGPAAGQRTSTEIFQ